MKPAVVALLVVLLAVSLSAQKNKKTTSPSIVSGWNYSDINSVNATVSDDGVFADYRRTNSAGLEWPRGSGRTAVYGSGLWVIGKHRPTDSIRCAVMEYRSEFVPGTVPSLYGTNGTFRTVDDGGMASFRLYKANRNVYAGDAMIWPAERGAPYSDQNGNGSFDAGIDSPVRWGDQLLWTVSNDIGSSDRKTLSGTRPLGIEVHTTVFSYDVTGPLADAVFIRYTIINRSDADYDSVCIGYWSDIDMGAANDDMIGCDTVRGMFYVYNGDESDEGSRGYGVPPAVGFVLLQGPMIPTGIMADTARTLERRYAGAANLPMSSFVCYSNSAGQDGWVDPPNGQASFGRVALNNLNGRVSFSGLPMTVPSTGQKTRFAFSGDPVTGTGWNYADEALAGDVRGVLGSGPFTMSKGDTQEVVIAFVAAQGTGRLNSIAALRSAVDTVISVYRGGFTIGDMTETLPRMYCERTASAIPFETIDVGRSSDTVSIQFWNTGIDTLSLSFSSFSATAFVRVTPHDPVLRLASGEGSSVRILFAPAGSGMFVDSLVITTNDPKRPLLTFRLTGRGVIISPAASGTLYATANFIIYSVSSTTGTATPVVTPETGYQLICVRPPTKVMYGFGGDHVARIGLTSGSIVREYHSFPSSIFIGGTGFLGDSVMVMSTDSAFVLYNVVTRAIDTLVHFVNGIRPRVLAVHPTESKIYFSRFSQFSMPDTVDALYMYDIPSQSTVRIGRTLQNKTLTGLQFDQSGILYGLSGNALVRIDTSTGKAISIGATGISGIRSLTMDPNSVAGVRPEPGVHPSVFALHQNYPNPFNPSTVITYDVPVTDEVRLEVFDMLGRKAATLVSEVQSAGRYSVRADAAALGLSSGVYIYALRSGSFTSARKMSIVK